MGNDQVRRLQHRGLVEALAHPGLERHFGLHEPEFLEVVDEQDDPHPSASEFSEQPSEENAVGNGGELDHQRVSLTKTRKSLLPEFICVPMFFQGSHDRPILPLERDVQIHFFHSEFREGVLHVRPGLVGGIFEMGVLRFPLGNVIAVLVHNGSFRDSFFPILTENAEESKNNSLTGRPCEGDYFERFEFCSNYLWIVSFSSLICRHQRNRQEHCRER